MPGSTVGIESRCDPEAKSVEVGGLPFDMRPGGFDLSGIDVIRPRRIDGQTVLPAFLNDDEEDLHDDLV